MNLMLNANLDGIGGIDNLLFEGRQTRYKAISYRPSSGKNRHQKFVHTGEHEVASSTVSARSLDDSRKNILKGHNLHFLKKCQNNIYSDASGGESDDPHFGIYKQKNITYLEKKVKDEFN
jgi:hypothetical protein